MMKFNCTFTSFVALYACGICVSGLALLPPSGAQRLDHPGSFRGGQMMTDKFVCLDQCAYTTGACVDIEPPVTCQNTGTLCGEFIVSKVVLKKCILDPAGATGCVNDTSKYCYRVIPCTCKELGEGFVCEKGNFAEQSWLQSPCSIACDPNDGCT